MSQEQPSQPDKQTAETIYLGSDNQAGAHPKILEALAKASEGMANAYSEDALSETVSQRFEEVFETPCEVYLVATGTAANSLVLSAMCPPWGAILCHEGAHIINDENTAPEFFTGGARQIGLPGSLGKPDHLAIREQVQAAQLHGVHNVKPAAISLTNATEQGTVIRPDEVGGLVWMPDLGATKNGAIAAEAVVFFNDRFSDGFAYRRKRAGHLWSKHRFLAAQFDAFLSNDLWLRNARHANDLAAQLSAGLAIPGVSVPWPTQANEVFPVLQPGIDAALRAAGFDYYDWPVVRHVVRLVTSFATDPRM